MSSFENLFDGDDDDSTGMQFPYYDDYITSSPAFSLGQLLDNAEGDMGADGAMEGVGDADAENDSRSESDNNLDAISGGGEDEVDDDFEPGNSNNSNSSSNRKRRYHRHTPQQIKELEALFKECPHPEEKQRAELSKRLGLDPRQVKFWFQNRRTQLKTQLDRYENALLKQEHEKLMTQNKTLKEAMLRGPMCVRCGSPASPGAVCLEEQHLRNENGRINAEIERVSAIAAKLLGKPISVLLESEEQQQVQPTQQPPCMPRSSLDQLPDDDVGGLGRPMGTLPSAAMVPDGTMSGFAAGRVSSSPLGTVITTTPAAPAARAARPPPPPTVRIDRTILLELAISSMDELVKMAQMDEPLWLKTIPGSFNKEMLNLEQYARSFLPWMGTKPVDFVSDASRDSGIVINCNSAALVETLMDEKRWSDMFPCMIANARTLEEVSTGIAGSRNGNLLLMKAEIQVLSPLVPVREVKFLRYCKQLAEGTWAVVDASIDGLMGDQNSATTSTAGNAVFRRLPSGCVIEDGPNGYCKVTWVEHTEYDEASVHQLYRPLLRCGLAFGAKRWLANLQSQCESLAILMSPDTVSVNGPSGVVITQEGKLSMLNLARRMTGSFCAGVNASSERDWIKLDCAAGILGEDVHVMARKSVNEPGEPPGVVVSVATSVWVPVAREKLFNFLRNERLRAEWDILSNGGPMQEMANLSKGPQGNGNSVSLLRATTMTSNQNSLVILQETCADASGYMVVYAPVDIPGIQLVMNGGDSTYVALLPSGFVILPDGPGIDASGILIGGSLLTAAFQILVNSQPTANLTLESVETVSNLISCTIKKIRSALRGGTSTS